MQVLLLAHGGCIAAHWACVAAWLLGLHRELLSRVALRLCLADPAMAAHLQQPLPQPSAPDAMEPCGFPGCRHQCQQMQRQAVLVFGGESETRRGVQGLQQLCGACGHTAAWHRLAAAATAADSAAPAAPVLFGLPGSAEESKAEQQCELLRLDDDSDDIVPRFHDDSDEASAASADSQRTTTDSARGDSKTQLAVLLAPASLSLSSSLSFSDVDAKAAQQLCSKVAVKVKVCLWLSLAGWPWLGDAQAWLSPSILMCRSHSQFGLIYSTLFDLCAFFRHECFFYDTGAAFSACHLAQLLVGRAWLIVGSDALQPGSAASAGTQSPTR